MAAGPDRDQLAVEIDALDLDLDQPASGNIGGDCQHTEHGSTRAGNHRALDRLVGTEFQQRPCVFVAQHMVEGQPGPRTWLSNHQRSGQQLIPSEWSGHIGPRVPGGDDDRQAIGRYLARRESTVNRRALNKPDVRVAIQDEPLDLLGVGHLQTNMERRVRLSHLVQPRGYEVFCNGHARCNVEVRSGLRPQGRGRPQEVVDHVEDPMCPVSYDPALTSQLGSSCGPQHERQSKLPLKQCEPLAGGRLADSLGTGGAAQAPETPYVDEQPK